MGMFDSIRLESVKNSVFSPIFKKYKGSYQTKDLDCLLYEYVINDGCLYLNNNKIDKTFEANIYEYKFINETKSQIKHRDIELYIKIVDGKLANIKVIKDKVTITKKNDHKELPLKKYLKNVKFEDDSFNLQIPTLYSIGKFLLVNNTRNSINEKWSIHYGFLNLDNTGHFTKDGKIITYPHLQEAVEALKTYIKENS